MPSQLNILEGPSRFFLGVANTDVLPADTVALGGSWGGSWRDVGYLTEEGVSITFNQTFNPVMSSQDRNPILQLPGATNDTIACTFTEATLLNIKAATGRGTINSVAPVGATPGYDNLALAQSTSINYIALGFEGIAPPNNKSNPRRILFPRAMATASVAINQRIGQPTGIPAQFARMGGVGNDPNIHDVTTT
jgi:hypothetical protein